MVVADARLRQRNLSEARSAFEVEDENAARELSRMAHCAEPSCSESGHNDELSHTGMTLALRGCVDGLTMGLTLMTVGNTAGWPTNFTVMLSGLLIGAWALYLGCREALESVTYKAYYTRERQREKWELDNYPEGEVAEMITLYKNKGIPEENAKQIIELMAQSQNFFVDVMMLEELQMSPPPTIGAIETASRISGGCLIAGGALPLVSAVADRAFRGNNSYLLLLILGLAALAYVGTLRAAITHQGKRRLALQTVAAATPCLIVAHIIGCYLPPISAMLATMPQA